eukprot:gene4724-5172_t
MERKADKQSVVRARAAQYAKNKYLNDLVEEEGKKGTTITTSQSSTATALPKSPKSPSRRPPPSSSSSSAAAATTSSSSSSTEAMLHRLTQKLTSHIREEVVREQWNEHLAKKEVCETIVARIDHFVQKELSSFSCAICYEIMAPPDHVPMLLFPCGHTFCEACIANHLRRNTSAAIQQHQQQNGRQSRGGGGGFCPFCRQSIESRAVNQSLKELIEQFIAQKDRLESGRASIEDLFISQKAPAATTSAAPPPPPHVPLSSSQAQPSSISTSSLLSQLKSCEMRHGILSNELEEAFLEVDALQKKQAKIRKASDHLLEERRKLDERVALLQEERALINQHLDNQQSKAAETAQAEGEAQERSRMLKETLGCLQREMDKLRLLVQGVRGE